MDDKKYTLFKMIHLILMALTILVTLIGMVQMTMKLGSGNDAVVAVRLLSSLVRILAMVVGILYLISGYKKSSAGYYKLFFWLMMIALVFRLLVFITRKADTLMLVGGVITIILAFVLMAGKDLGRNLTFCLLALLIIVEIALKFPIGLSDVSIGQLGGELSMFMLYGTAGFMATAKYIDKSLRGSK